MAESINQLSDRLERELAAEPFSARIKLISSFAAKHALPVVFGTSFGVEDQMLTALIAAAGFPVKIFTLDTGRLFPETYEVWKETEERYNLKIDCYFPEAQSVSSYVAEEGINGFYNSIASRQRCCGIRKVEPLTRALAGAGIWISGLRHEQDPERKAVRFAEFDERFKVIKTNPLVDLTSAEMWAQVKAENIPYHRLHDSGFPSIGCAPCTRAIKDGETLRAGRWWWEAGLPKECGLHHLFAGQERK